MFDGGVRALMRSKEKPSSPKDIASKEVLVLQRTLPSRKRYYRAIGVDCCLSEKSGRCHTY
eukprot:11726335-Ditylum_brightwellii.AAC.1